MMDGEIRYQIGPFTLVPAARRIVFNAFDIGADAQQVGVLTCLCEQYPGIVDKATLINSVWGGAYVTDAALQKTISTLRKLLQHHDPGWEGIQTRHRRGYQLVVAPVVLPPAVAAVSSQSSSPSSDVRPRYPFWLGAALLVLGVLSWLVSPGRGPAEASGETFVLAAEPGIDLPPLMSGALEAQSEDDLLRIAEAAERRDPELATAAARRLLVLAQPGVDAVLEAKARRHLGVQAMQAGNGDEALAQLQQAHALAEQAGDMNVLAGIAHSLGSAHLRMSGGQQVPALEWALRAVDLREHGHDTAGLGSSLSLLLDSQLRLGRINEARQTLSRMQTLATSEGSDELAVQILLAEGALVYQAGGDAVAPLRQALEKARQSGKSRLAAVAAQRLAVQHSIRREHEIAADLLRQARTHLRAAGDLIDLGLLSYNEATLAERAEDYDRARALYRRSLEESTMRVPSTMRVHAWLAIHRISAGEIAEQARLAGYREAMLLNEPVPLAYALSARADADIMAGDLVSARSMLEEANELVGATPDIEIDVHLRRLSIWTALVDGRLDEARTRIHELDALFAQRETGDVVGVADYLRRALERIQTGEGEALAMFEETHPGWVQARDRVLREAAPGEDSPFRFWPALTVAGLAVLWLARRRGLARNRRQGAAASP